MHCARSIQAHISQPFPPRVFAANASALWNGIASRYTIPNRISTRNSHSSRIAPKSLKTNGRVSLYPERPGASLLSLAFLCQKRQNNFSPTMAAAPIAPRDSLVDFIREFASRRNEVFIAHRRGYRMERASYGEILDDSIRFARELESRGIAKADAVLLWGEPSAAWVSAFFGCVLRGAVAVPIDQISTVDFASRVAREVKAKLIVRSRESAQIDSPIPSLEFESLSAAIAPRASSPFASPTLTRDDTLEIIFTSGTTAEPRGVVISHGNILANIDPLDREIRKYLRYERPVHPLRFLNLLPLSHIFGQIMGIFIPPLLGGAVIFSGSLKPSELIDAIRREKVSVLVSVPRLVESLQREIERDLEAKGQTQDFRRRFESSAGKHFLRRWWIFRNIRRRFGWKFWAIISGGATLPENTETFWNRLGYAVIQGYGMTETASLITLNHPFRLGKGSIGKAFPGTEIKISESGEILVRGDNIAKSYRQSEQLQPVVGADAWFHTGDLAEAGPDGRLYFKGRQKSVIVTPAGMKVYPEDLEEALRRQKGVRDCVVIGLPRDGNEEPCAALLLDRPGANPGAVVDSANQSLAEYQRIRYWFEWPDPDFPRTPTQKPQLERIRQAAAARFGAPSAAASVKARSSGSPVADLIAKITGRAIDSNSPDAVRGALAQMSSLDRVELMSAMEDRYQVDLSEANFAQASTVDQLEQLVREPQAAPLAYEFPQWPQNRLITAMRLAAYYSLVWPATYLLAAPRVKGRQHLRNLHGPALVVSNHVTDIDIGWILAALPLRFRHRLATAMGGERLAGMRHPPPTLAWLSRLIQRLDYLLVVALFNVFPLPRQSAFLRSFSFAGDLADRGWNILVFPEGATTKDGRIAQFRAGIGLLATRLNVPVIPIRIDGAFGPKQRHRRYAAPGEVRVTIGEPARYAPDRDPQEIAADLQRRVEAL
jgi:long-chain acyl-CoA synthetase